MTDEQIAEMVSAAGFVLEAIDRGVDGSVCVFYTATRSNGSIMHSGCEADRDCLSAVLANSLARVRRILGKE